MAQLPGRIITTVEGWRERYLLQRELDGLSRRGELERTLADSGIAPSELPRLLNAHPRTREQLAEMMQRLGIDRAALPHSVGVVETLRAAEWVCSDCADWRKCRAWLAAPNAPGSYRDFCPNAEALDRLRCGETAHPAPGHACGILAELAAAPDGGRS